MAGTGITVVLVAVLVQSIYASKLINKLALNEGKETPMKRSSDPYEYLGGCYDNHDYCQYWASIGECYNNPQYMLSSCQYSCGMCVLTGGGVYYKRDVTIDFGNKPPGTRDDSPKQLKTDDDIMKRALELGQFIQRRLAGSHSQGNSGAPGTRETESK